MNLSSKIFLIFTILSMRCNLPLQAAPSRISSKAIVGLWAAAGSMIASGAAAVADSIRKDKLKETKVRLFELEQEYQSMKLNLYDTKKRLESIFPEAKFVMIAGAAMLTVGTLILCVLLQHSQPTAVTDKQEPDSVSRSSDLNVKAGRQALTMA